MENAKCYENFPASTLILSNLVSLLIYGAGTLILFKLGPLFGGLYLIYIIFLEYRLLRYHCTKCYYWGKSCGFGKGRISALLFRQGDNTKFSSLGFSWKDMIPDMLVSLVPVTVGVILLIIKFNLIILFTLIIIIILTTMGNGFIRGQLTCKYCKQRELGCPAEELFNKNK